MVTKMILITILILAILFATWVKDREEMNPPFKRRLVIDLTVVFSLWVLYAVFFFTQTPSTSDIAKTVIDVASVSYKHLDVYKRQPYGRLLLLEFKQHGLELQVFSQGYGTE